jgi:hypothetical protein
MAVQSPNYSGENAGVRVAKPSGQGFLKAQDKLSDFFTKTEELRLKIFRENAQEFQKNTKIDPVFLLSDSARKFQSELLTDFNNTWGAVMQKSGGVMTEQDKAKMASHKASIQMEQQRMQADMAIFEKQQELVDKNPGRYNRESFYKNRATKFYNEGVLDRSEPELIPKTLSEYAASGKYKISGGTPSYTDQEVTVGGKRYKRTYRTMGGVNDAAPLVVSLVLGEDQARQATLFEWESLTPEEKMKYFDLNNDKVIDARESQMGETIASKGLSRGMSRDHNNPILKMAIDRHWKEFIDTEPVADQAITEPSSGGGDFWATINVGGSPTKYQPTSDIPTQIGNTQYNTYHEYQRMPTWNISPSGGVRVLESDKITDTDIQPKTTLSVQLTGYDEEKDEFTFTVMKDFKNLTAPDKYHKGAGSQIAVKRSALSPEIFNNMEIIKNGQKFKVGNLTPSTQVTVGGKKEAYPR